MHSNALRWGKLNDPRTESKVTGEALKCLEFQPETLSRVLGALPVDLRKRVCLWSVGYPPQERVAKDFRETVK